MKRERHLGCGRGSVLAPCGWNFRRRAATTEPLRRGRLERDPPPVTWCHNRI